CERRDSLFERRLWQGEPLISGELGCLPRALREGGLLALVPEDQILLRSVQQLVHHVDGQDVGGEGGGGREELFRGHGLPPRLDRRVAVLLVELATLGRGESQEVAGVTDVLFGRDRRGTDRSQSGPSPGVPGARRLRRGRGNGHAPATDAELVVVLREGDLVGGLGRKVAALAS